MRGEYQAGITVTCDLWELPPRARRIRAEDAAEEKEEGTTSACAENTANWGAWPALTWNYLRVRGEYLAPLW